MRVLIPAGGRGVRLQPLTNLCPKPLLLLGDRPILTRIVESLPLEYSVTVLVSPSLAEDFHRWRESLPDYRDVTVYVEAIGDGTPRGPVTAMGEFLRDHPCDDDLLVMMGDSLLPFTARDFLADSDPSAIRLAAYRLDDIQDAGRFGVLEWNAAFGVVSFEEKPAEPKSPWVFTGCFYLPRRLTRSLITFGEQGLPQVGHAIAAFLASGERVSVFPVAGEWHDIGTYRSYIAAHEVLLLPHGASQTGVVWVSPSALVTESTLRDCVVHAGGRVGHCQLARCVVQPGVELDGVVAEDRLFTPGGDLPLGNESSGVEPLRALATVG